MMNSVASLLDFAKSSAALAQSKQITEDNGVASATNTARSSSTDAYDLPEKVAAVPIPSTLTNIKKAAASTGAGPLKKRSAGDQNKPSSPKQQGSKPKKPRRAIPENKEYIPESEQPTDADVVGGRGGRSNHHAGNRPYWIKILGSRFHYRTCQSDAAKTVIAQDILNFIKLDKGGRFLNLDSKTNRWFILPDAVVLDKIKQALRDKYVPFWAKNMDIPNVPPGGASSLSMAASMLRSGHQDVNSWNTRSQVSAKLTTKPDDGNKLGFLLSASRAAAANSSTAAIPTMDDALKCKIDTLPTFGQDGVAAGTSAGDLRMPFTFSGGFPGAAGSGARNTDASLGMGMFHSVHNANLLASMASLGGGGGVSHGFGVGGNSGAPSLGGGGLPPYAAATGSLYNSIGLQSSDLDRIFDTSKMTNGARSVDLLQSLAGGNMASFASLGGVSFGLPDSLTAAAAAGGNKASSSVPSGTSSPNTSGNKKTDWNAMFKTALKKEEV
ncbi:hypothetical protein IV203_026013 [Nitzschia inconspicua]|uniref:DUF6824 domain-containing protein n=1 Tax=Nitzschia inconspicua TaxID=303405 RepID=A0A9K3PWV1_9STRA|nr:hypothetical protein IV203_026013 [Nitzschia inconspicua]